MAEMACEDELLSQVLREIDLLPQLYYAFIVSNEKTVISVNWKATLVQFRAIICPLQVIFTPLFSVAALPYASVVFVWNPTGKIAFVCQTSSIELL